MKDYRPLLSDISALLDAIDSRWTTKESFADALLGWSYEDIFSMNERVNEMFNELDDEYGD